jgi:hypothetical protein
LIKSQGGKRDDLINTSTDRHARIFRSNTELELAGYINASDDDLKAISNNPKIGLVIH